MVKRPKTMPDSRAARRVLRIEQAFALAAVETCADCSVPVSPYLCRAVSVVTDTVIARFFRAHFCEQTRDGRHGRSMQCCQLFPSRGFFFSLAFFLFPPLSPFATKHAGVS